MIKPQKKNPKVRQYEKDITEREREREREREGEREREQQYHVVHMPFG